MYIKKKMKRNLIIVAVIALAFIYWRGVSAVTEARGLDCSFHVVYAYCKGKAPVKVPTIVDVFKAGVKFK